MFLYQISATVKKFWFVNEAHFLSLSDDKMDLNHQLKAIQKITLIFKMRSPNEILARTHNQVKQGQTCMRLMLFVLRQNVEVLWDQDPFLCITRQSLPWRIYRLSRQDFQNKVFWSWENSCFQSIEWTLQGSHLSGRRSGKALPRLLNLQTSVLSSRI